MQEDSLSKEDCLRYVQRVKLLVDEVSRDKEKYQQMKNWPGTYWLFSLFRQYPPSVHIFIHPEYISFASLLKVNENEKQEADDNNNVIELGPLSKIEEEIKKQLTHLKQIYETDSKQAISLLQKKVDDIQSKLREHPKEDLKERLQTEQSILQNDILAKHSLLGQLRAADFLFSLLQIKYNNNNKKNKRKIKKSQPLIHRKYQSIENNSDLNLGILQRNAGLKAGQWVITEKIHGANFTFITDGKEIKCAKRSAILPDTNPFYGWKDVHRRYTPSILNAFKYIHDREKKLNNNNVSEICIYGELFGGHYPHEKVTPIEGNRFVQKGIWYCAEVEFFPFDIYIVGDERKGYLDFDQVLEIVKEAKFRIHVQPIMIGEFEELIKFDVDTFESRVPKELGLPLLEGNIAEGVVIRPIKEKKWPDGGGIRLMLKKKSKNFQEITGPKRPPKKIYKTDNNRNFF